MASFNAITIVGYLGRDPELTYTPNGNAACKFSIATTEKRGQEEKTTWFRVTTWGKQAETCNEYLRKGLQAYVTGRVSLQEYTDKDGSQRSSLEVTASDVRFLSSKSDSQEAPQQRAASAGKGFGVEKGTGRVISPPIDDDSQIPF